MNLFRLLTWLLVIWIFWFMIRNYLAKETRKKPAKPALPQKIVQCQYCSVHTPESEAIQHDTLWFCSQSHVQSYLAHKKAADK